MNCEASSWVGARSRGSPAVQLPAQLVELAQVLLGAGQVVADEDPEPLHLRVVPHEPGHVLGRVLARLGREVAEPAEDLDPDPALQLRVGVDHLGQLRVERAAAVLEAQHERLVIESGGHEADLGRVDADQAGQERVRVPDRVAQPEDPARSRSPRRPPTAASPSGSRSSAGTRPGSSAACPRRGRRRPGWSAARGRCRRCRGCRRWSAAARTWPGCRSRAGSRRSRPPGSR